MNNFVYWAQISKYIIIAILMLYIIRQEILLIKFLIQWFKKRSIRKSFNKVEKILKEIERLEQITKEEENK